MEKIRLFTDKVCKENNLRTSEVSVFRIIAMLSEPPRIAYSDLETMIDKTLENLNFKEDSDEWRR